MTDIRENASAKNTKKTCTKYNGCSALYTHTSSWTISDVSQMQTGIQYVTDTVGTKINLNVLGSKLEHKTTSA